MVAIAENAAEQECTYIDTHIHLDDEVYRLDLDGVISAARADGVKYMVCPGSDWESSKRVWDLAHNRACDGIYCAVGIHPHSASEYCDEYSEWVKGLRTHALHRLVAIGEIGLDYHYDLSPRQVQRAVFAAQIALAREMRLPLIVHDREAHHDALDILGSERADEIGGVLHCFSGSWEIAKLCLDLGFFISFAGPVTFKNAARVREVAARVPLDRLLPETDGPYLTPEPFRGKRNEPRHVTRVAQRLAELKGVSTEEACAVFLDNAHRLFGINGSESDVPS